MNTKDDFGFTAIYDEEGFRFDSMRFTSDFVSIVINDTKVDIKEMEIYGLYEDNGKAS